MDPLLALTLGAVAVSLLAVADGVDLGIGILFPLVRRERDRAVLMQSVTPFRHGNEAWLALGAVGLCTALPLGYQQIPVAFLPPIAAMLSALILRGVVLEFRVHATRFQSARVAALAGGSLVAALCQGLILGGCVQLASARTELFGNGLLDCLSPPGLVCAATIASGYVLLGAGFWFRARLVTADPTARADARPREVRSGPYGVCPCVVNGAPDYVRKLAPGE